MDFYLGIDIGTSRVKAVLFDQHFTACASAAENTSPRLSANGYAEQDMTQLWHSVLAILRQIARHPALQAGRLRAIGLAGQGEGVWLSDEQGEPVGPGILWSDTRSHELMSDLLRRPGFDRRYFADTGTHLLHRDRLPRPADGERGDALCHPYRSRTGDLPVSDAGRYAKH